MLLKEKAEAYQATATQYLTHTENAAVEAPVLSGSEEFKTNSLVRRNAENNLAKAVEYKALVTLAMDRVLDIKVLLENDSKNIINFDNNSEIDNIIKQVILIVTHARNYNDDANKFLHNATEKVTQAKIKLIPSSQPAQSQPAQSQPAQSQPAPLLRAQQNFDFEVKECTEFLKEIDDKKYNTELTQNIVSQINYYMNEMKKHNYFYDTNVGEYKVSYLYNKSNDIKNI